MKEKKLCIIGACLVCLCSLSSIAQENKTKISSEGQPQMRERRARVTPKDWHLRSFVTDTVYGADIYRAYDYLKDRQPKKKTIVAIIDGGGDITHEDIKDNIWVNKGEIPGNGIDDDGNGYVDDVHGWNFLGYSDGRQLSRALLEADREYLRLWEKYSEVDTGCLSRKEREEYSYFTEQVQPESELYRLSKGKNQKIYQTKLAQARESVQRRLELGDNVNKLSDRKYGNNNLLDKSAMHGTHVAGIVGATRNNNCGMDGVADVELMMIRVNAGGDEADKEVAAAIYYAVNNGARVINMSFGKYLSPNKKWVGKAMYYAERKGVLLVHAAGNNNKSIDQSTVYPTKQLTPTRTLKNFITVGSIGPWGQPARSSNYGKMNVDLFAPGDGIYSTVLNNQYKQLGGTSMAAPMVTGVIALIWNYFPELTAAQVKQAILEGAISCKGKQVNLPKGAFYFGKPTKIDFDELCSTGGMLNALEAVKIAESMSKKR